MIKANTSNLVLMLLMDKNAMANGFITKIKRTMVFAKIVLKMKSQMNKD